MPATGEATKSLGGCRRGGVGGGGGRRQQLEVSWALERRAHAGTAPSMQRRLWAVLVAGFGPPLSTQQAATTASAHRAGAVHVSQDRHLAALLHRRHQRRQRCLAAPAGLVCQQEMRLLRRDPRSQPKNRSTDRRGRALSSGRADSRAGPPAQGAGTGAGEHIVMMQSRQQNWADEAGSEQARARIDPRPARCQQEGGLAGGGAAPAGRQQARGAS